MIVKDQHLHFRLCTEWSMLVLTFSETRLIGPKIRRIFAMTSERLILVVKSVYPRDSVELSESDQFKNCELTGCGCKQTDILNGGKYRKKKQFPRLRMLKTLKELFSLFQVDSHYCPNCLENMPSAEAKLKKNRQVNLESAVYEISTRLVAMATQNMFGQTKIT